jgi:predicted dehydrogenase
MRKLKLGVLGVSNHFIKRVLFPLKKSDKVEIYALASRSEEKAEASATKYGIKKWYGSYEALLNDDEIEAVYLPLPNHLHVEYIKKAADAHKHIICEKPLALNYESAKEAFEYAENRDVLLMEAFMYKHHPQWLRTKEIVDSRELGDIQSVHCYFSYDNKDPKNIRNIPEFGGGALLDIGVYAVSSARWIFGTEPSKVISLLNKDEEFNVDVLVSGILDFGGKRSLFTVATQAFPAQNVEIYGSAGTLTVEIPFNTYSDVPAHLHVETGIGSRDVYLGPADHYLLEFEHFARAIKGEISISSLKNDSLNNIKVIDALFRSAKEEKWISLK